MGWALIFMTCARVCTPQYVELYQTKAQCIAKMPKDKPMFASEFQYCVPVAKNE